MKRRTFLQSLGIVLAAVLASLLGLTAPANAAAGSFTDLTKGLKKKRKKRKKRKKKKKKKPKTPGKKVN